MKANEWEVMKYFPWIETCRHLRMFTCFIILRCLIFVWLHHDAWYSSEDFHKKFSSIIPKKNRTICLWVNCNIKISFYFSTHISNYVRYIFPLIMKTDCHNFCYRPAPWHSAFGKGPKYKNVVDFYRCFIIIKVLIRSGKLKKNYIFK